MYFCNYTHLHSLISTNEQLFKKWKSLKLITYILPENCQKNKTAKKRTPNELKKNFFLNIFYSSRYFPRKTHSLQLPFLVAAFAHAVALAC